MTTLPTTHSRVGLAELFRYSVFNVFPFDPNQSGAFGPHVAVNVEAHFEPVFVDRLSGPVPSEKDHAQRNRNRNEVVSAINGAKSR
jgi:hypothetical protein